MEDKKSMKKVKLFILILSPSIARETNHTFYSHKTDILCTLICELEFESAYFKNIS